MGKRDPLHHPRSCRRRPWAETAAQRADERAHGQDEDHVEIVEGALERRRGHDQAVV